MRFVNDVYQDIWAIKPSLEPGVLAAIERGHEIDVRITDGPTSSYEAATRATKFGRVKNKLGILPVTGVITQRASFFSMLFGGTSTELLGVEFDKLMADAAVGVIVLDINSPGGTVAGVPEVADKIYRARGDKPIIAAVNSLAASAAFWIAAAADEIVITPSGEIGSVGCIAIHTEFSALESAAGIATTIIRSHKYKGEGNRHEPLGESARDYVQQRVDTYGDMFVAALAKYRGTTVAKVEKEYGQGRVYGAKDAVERGMADRVAPFDRLMLDLLPGDTGVKQRSRSRAQNMNRLNMF